MGKDLAERFPAARHLLQEIDDALGVPLSRLMFAGPEGDLTATHNAQPAILAHSVTVHALVAPAMRAAPAVAAAGHSLGEYSAYVTAGALGAAPAARLRLELEQAPFREPAFPVIANATAEPVTDAARARRLLGEQLTAPVRWTACMEQAAELAGADARFIEIGPGNVLAGLLKRIVPGATVVSLGTADEVERFLEAA